jgi:hypothetical protein
VLATLLLLVAGSALADDTPAAVAPAAPAQAQWTPGQPGSELEIALLTVGPGDVYWQRFGHNAIWVRDRARQTEVLYNYGIFDFEERDFFWNFLRGRMRYSMAARRPADDIDQYLAEGRQVDVQILELAPAQRIALRDFLAWNALPENARYRYDYFLSNCSTKVRDALDSALGGALKAASDGRSRGYTQRMHALRLTSPDPLVYLGVHAGLGPSTDRAMDFWAEMFIPMEVARRLREVGVRDDAGTELPLVSREFTINAGRVTEPLVAPDWRWRFLAAGLALGALLYWLGSGSGVRRRCFGVLAGTTWLLAGLAGLVLLGLWLGTEHVAAWHNRNIALFNPLGLLLLPAAWRALRGRAPQGSFVAHCAALVLGLAAAIWLAQVLPAGRQDIGDWVALWLPVHFAGWQVLRQRANAA